MARKVRIQYPGAVYHVMSRGDRREDIFLSDRDRYRFLDTLQEACDRSGFFVLSYVLMTNHYHLLLETPEGNLVDGMRWLQGTYTIRFNLRNNHVGHVFQGRYKAIPVDADEPDYFRLLSHYIHLNPARARLLGGETPSLSSYPWSSYRAFISGKPLPRWLVRQRVFGALGLRGEGASDRRRYRGLMELLARELYSGDAGEELAEEWRVLRRGWYAGDESFRERLETLADKAVRGKRRSSYDRTGLTRHDERIAKQWLGNILTALGVDTDEFRALRPSDPLKQAVIWSLRSRSMVTASWLDDQVGVGHASNVSRAVSAFRSPADRKGKQLKRKVMQVCRVAQAAEGVGDTR